MILTNKLDMDLTRYNGNPIIRAMQDDRYSRNLEISLLEDGSAWVIPENCTVLIRYSKPDGKGGEYDTLPDGSCAWSVSGNVLTVALAPQMMTVAGAVRLAVTLMMEQVQLTTFSITLSVEPAVNAQIGESEVYFHVPGFLPAPASAEEGQFFRITSVDSAGHVTALEAVTLEGSQASEEPAEEDIPKVFFGAGLPQTKTNTVMPFRYVSKTMDIRGYCKTKAQGNSSLSYPKKNQTVKLYEDEACTKALKIAFKNWGLQNKFCLKANWIDLTHARNVVSARLWGDVVKSRDNYADLPTQLKASPNQGAVDGFPVKVYAGGIYQGRYTLNIPKDAWMANMDAGQENHCILCSENYASGCFRAEAVIDETDWTDEIHDTVPESIKTRWNEVISFVRNSTDEEFRSNLGNYFDVQSLIDYHLFGLASCGLDAYSKNQLYMTYDGQKWIASMYDMDSTWGLYWNGSSFVSASYPRTSYEDYMSSASDGSGNLLYIRLEALFSQELLDRWEVLKNGALSIANIISHFERFTDIAPADLVAEDYAPTTADGAFTAIPLQDANNIQQIRAYALARQAWTTEYLTGSSADSPAYPLLSGTFTHDYGTLTVSGGNHIAVTKVASDTSANLNIYDPVSNVAYSSADNYSQDAYFTIPAGSDITINIKNWDFQAEPANNYKVTLFLKDTAGTAYDIFSSTINNMTTDSYTASLTAEADIPVGCIGIYVSWSSAEHSWSAALDLEMYVNGQQYV